jgi:DNA-binding transcriptional LysR family regulator
MAANGMYRLLHPASYTKIQIDLVATNEYLDLVAQNIDIAIRAHRQPLADSGYVQRQLGFAPNYLVASPAYLGSHGEPESPEDLVEHFGLFPDGKFPHWKLISQEGQELPAHPQDDHQRRVR